MRGVAWTPEEDAILRKWAGDVSAERLTERLPGRTAKAIRCRATLLELQLRSPKRLWTTTQDKKLREMAGKFPASEIARVIGRTQKAVNYRIKALGLSGRLYGEAHWAAKITELQARMIRTLRTNGFSNREIKAALGAGFDISMSSIQAIGSGEQWRR